MSSLTFFAGICSIVFSLWFIVIPAIWVRIDYLSQPISHTGTLPYVGRIFNTGLVGAGISQMLFAIGLYQDIAVSFLPLGLVIFVAGTICIVIAGVIPLSRSSNIHSALAGAYYILTPIGGILFEFTLSSVKPEYKPVGVILGVIVLCGVLYFYHIRKSAAYAALWGIALSVFWILRFYIN